MNVSAESFVVPVVLVGGILIADLLLTAVLRRTVVPAVVVHLLLGVALAFADAQWSWVREPAREALHFLGSVGVVFLLFRVGLRSKIGKLLENLRAASLVWVADVFASGTLGFAVTYYGLGLGLVPSLFAAAALTATSVGVGVAAWQERGALQSRRGQLLLDVAELDDISGIVLMAILFAVAPLVSKGGSIDALLGSVAGTGGAVLLRLALFALGVALFSRFAEAPLTRLVGRLEPPPDRLITVVSVGLVVAAAAGSMGFSLAIGAFFGGLAFSRDPSAVRLETYFDPLYDFFTPFFFIAIGLQVSPESLVSGLGIGLLVFLVAVAGKLLGAGAGSLLALRPRSATLVGVSMVPRAEIAMIIMQHGVGLGAWAVPEKLFSGFVVVSLLTCLLAPLVLRELLDRWRQVA